MGHIGTLAINPLVYPHHSYDPVKGWTSIAYVANVPNVLAVNAANVPATSVQELVALAKSKPGALAYGTGGTATASHLASAYFAYATGTGIPACALQGHRAVRERPGGGAPADGLLRRACDDAACQAGQPARPRQLERGALRGLPRAANHRGVGLCRL